MFSCMSYILSWNQYPVRPFNLVYMLYCWLHKHITYELLPIDCPLFNIIIELQLLL
jgi:hypothetical protein